jgi:YegS/Rv2252/BmrU family lipid kinase
MPSALVLYNPTAGRIKVLQSHGWQIEEEQSQNAEHLTQLASQAASEGMDAVLVAGGDGSINYAVAGLVGSDTALGVLPTGTSNVWAQELEMSSPSWTGLKAVEENAHLMAKANVWAVDVGFFNHKPFLMWASVGLDGAVVHQLEPRGLLAKHLTLLQYGATVVRTAVNWEGMQLRIGLEDQVIDQEFLMAIVSNIRLYAGGKAEISPNACLDDGVMDLWLFDGNNLIDTVRQAFDLLSGRHTRSDRTRCFPFQKMVIESDSFLIPQLDGEPVTAEDRCVKIEVRQRGLRVLVPQNVPASRFTCPPLRSLSE